MKLIDSIEAAKEKVELTITTKSAVRAIKQIIKLFKRIKTIQPKILGADTGMGLWSFTGFGVGEMCNYEYEGEPLEKDEFICGNHVYCTTDIEPYNFYDMIIEGETSSCFFKSNKALRELVELLDFYTDVNGLNCSEWQNSINSEGIFFRHSETSNQNNPFSTPNKAYQMDNDFYRKLVKAGVPIFFIDESKK